MERKKLGLMFVGTLCLCSSVVLADSTGQLLIAEVAGDAVVGDVRPDGGSPRGDDGCAIDNGPVNYSGIANGSQYDTDFPFWAQVADTFTLDCGAIACDGDANADGTRDPLDDGFVKARFGCDVGGGDELCDNADLNGDGEVDPLDSGYVQARFGPCPVGGDDGQALITQITFHSREYNPTCGNPGKWSGIRLTIYNDAGGIPDGEPQDDGTILGGPAVVDRIVSTSEFTWVEEVTNGFKVTVNTAMVVDNGTLYWLAISPMQPFQGEGQTGYFDTILDSGGDDIAAVQIFAVAGLPAWTPLIDAGSGLPREKAFTLTAEPASDTTGACCTGDSCSEGVDANECGGRFALGGGCGDLDPVCGTGACCAGDGSCTDGIAEACGGSFQGAGTNCATAGCPQPPPANDSCSGAIAIGDGATAYTTDGATSDGPLDGGDGACADPAVGYNDAWYVYEASCTGGLEVSLCSVCDGDTTVQLYDGSSCDPLGTQVGCGDDTCGIGAGPSLATSCSVTAGESVLIRIGAWNDGSLGDITTTGVITVTCSTEQQDCCETSSCGGCADDTIESCVCGIDPFCCDVMWDDACVDSVDAFGCGTCL